MLHPIIDSRLQTARVSFVTRLADYAATFPIDGAAAVQAARACLVDALARGFEALRDPDCAWQIGPLVPGATMPGGARVPGTSLELDPAQAAFCTALMVAHRGACEHAATSPGVPSIDALGAILAAADFQARKAMMAGTPPPTVREVLTAMVKALEIQSVLEDLSEAHHDPDTATARQARVAATAVVTALLGGTHGQIVAAVGHSTLDGDSFLRLQGDQAGGHRARIRAEAIGRAVRHACQATTPGRPSWLTCADMRIVELSGKLLCAGAAPAPKPFATRRIDEATRACSPSEVTRLTGRFQDAVSRYFPARQAERVKALFAQPERLDALPVNELIAALVTNGARQ